MAWADAKAVHPYPLRTQAKKTRRRLLNDFERGSRLAGPGPLRVGYDLFMGASHGSCFKHCPNNSSVQAQWSNLFRTGIRGGGRSAKEQPKWLSTRPIVLGGGNSIHLNGCGRSRHGKYLNQRGGRWFRSAHSRLMLAARGRVKIDGNACRDNDWGVITEVEIPRDTVEHGEDRKQDEARHPTAVEAVTATGDPERPHRIALDDGRVAADSTESKTEDESATGFPGEVQTPAKPKCAGAEKRCRKQETQHDRDGDAGF